MLKSQAVIASALPHLQLTVIHFKKNVYVYISDPSNVTNSLAKLRSVALSAHVLMAVKSLHEGYYSHP